MGLQDRLTGQAARAKPPVQSPTELLAHQALTVLQARMVNISRFDPLAQRLMIVALDWHSDSAYQRALAAAQKVVPGFDPTRHPVPARVNPAVEAVVIRGETVLVTFDEITRGTIHPWLIRLARVTMGLEWTFSAPVIARGTIAATFAAHFSHRPTDVQVQLAKSYAEECGQLFGGGAPSSVPSARLT